MNLTKTPMLSKSRFLAGLQCPLRVWHQCYNPELGAEVSAAQQAIFDTGHEVGRLATGLYSGGVLIEEDHLHHEEAVQSTRVAMSDSKVSAIYEAAFLYDDIRIRVDILERLNRGEWNLIEVKSSTSVKDVYLIDLALQYYVLRGLGLGIASAGILHINRQYVYDGNQLELEHLFSFSDMTREVIDLQAGFPPKIKEMKETLARTAPPCISPSRHCMNPHLCEFWEHCTAEMPEFWVMYLTGIPQRRLDELAAMGISDIRDIPDSFPLSAVQERIRECVASGEEFISQELEYKLKDAEYPIQFLDFETIGPAIPRYTGTRPYQTIAFQWSDHILHENGALEHREYLCLEDKDPREEFAYTLLEALGDKGTIFIYTSYETGVLNELAGALPHLGDQLLAVVDRFNDLHAAIRPYFYHPGFRGSFSLKSVLPALVPSMGYDKLAIQEGRVASVEYLRMLDPKTAPAERERIKNNLLTYCGHDTLGMVKISEALLKRFC